MAREGYFVFVGLNLEQTLCFVLFCLWWVLFVCLFWVGGGRGRGWLVGWLVFGLFVCLFVRAKQ